MEGLHSQIPLPGQLSHASPKLKRQQRRHHRGHRQPRPLEKMVHGKRFVRERIIHQPFMISKILAGNVRRACGRHARSHRRFELWCNDIYHILRLLHQCGPLFDQGVRTAARFFVHESGNRKDLSPWSAANRAVINEPLSIAASVTITPNDRPLMIRFLRGKCPLCGGASKENSDTTAPCSSISSRSR